MCNIFCIGNVFRERRPRKIGSLKSGLVKGSEELKMHCYLERV